MQIISTGDNLHEISKPVFWESKKNISVSSAENFTQSAKDSGQFYVYSSLRHLLWNGIVFCTCKYLHTKHIT